MKLSDAEIARRHDISVAAWEAMNEKEWADKYQEICDSIYWSEGKCCAGCDHWASDAGLTGLCTAAPIMSGADVLRSMGVTWSSYTPPPGHPYRRARFVCGTFSDDFDWSTLGDEYLTRIGAMVSAALRDKPRHQIESREGKCLK